jgi:hypothetical protein
MIRPLDMIGKNTEYWKTLMRNEGISRFIDQDIWLVKDFPDDTFTGISPYFVFVVLG